MWSVPTIIRSSKPLKTMVIRGAPAIGIAAAMGVALGAKVDKGP